MALITQSFTLDLIPGGLPTIVHVSQYDVSRTFVFTLMNGTESYTIPSGTTAKVSGTKYDGHGFLYSATVSTSNGTVTVNATEQMTAAAGPCQCEITLYDSNSNALGSANYVLLVEEAALTESAIESDSEITTVEGLVAQAVSDAQAAQTTVENMYSIIGEDAQTVIDNADRAETAAERAEASVDKMAWCEFSIDASDGHLYLMQTTMIEEEFTFSLNHSNGHMEVTTA